MGELGRRVYRDMRSMTAAATLLYCEACAAVTAHSVRDEGRDEVYRCQRCGATAWYRVR